MSQLPAWCRPGETFVGRSGLIEDVVDTLGAGPVTLTGPPGVGATTVAGAVAERLVEMGKAERAVAVRLDGCSNVSDAIRGIGYALHLPMPGDPATVRATLREGTPIAIVVDDADLAPEAAKQLLAITGTCPVIATGRETVLGTRIEVDPLPAPDLVRIQPAGGYASDYRGLPLLTQLPPAADPVDPWSTIQHIPGGSALLADIPMGLDDEGVPPSGELAPYLLPVRGRMLFRRSIRELLGGGPRPSAETLTAVVRDRIAELHLIAGGVDPLVTHEDITLLRTAAEQIQEPDLRALAGAAAARMMLRAFQGADAITLTQVLLSIRLPTTARALLRWVQGDAYIALGSAVEAQASWTDAARALHASNRPDVVSTMSRAVADRLLSRENTELAKTWVDSMEARHPGRSDRVAFADARRLAGHAAYVSGEDESVLARYAEGSAALRAGSAPPRAVAAVAIARATVHLKRGDHKRCQDQLVRASESAGEVPGLVAAISTISGELALRQGDVEAAMSQAERAAGGYRWTGDVAGLARVHRMLGDAYALSGRRKAAIQSYRESIRLGVRIRDVPNVRAALRRVALIEGEGDAGPHVEEAEALYEMAQGIGN